MYRFHWVQRHHSYCKSLVMPWWIYLTLTSIKANTIAVYIRFTWNYFILSHPWRVSNLAGPSRRWRRAIFIIQKDGALVVLLHSFAAPMETLLKNLQIFLLLPISSLCVDRVRRLIFFWLRLFGVRFVLTLVMGSAKTLLLFAWKHVFLSRQLVAFHNSKTGWFLRSLNNNLLNFFELFFLIKIFTFFRRLVCAAVTALTVLLRDVFVFRLGCPFCY